MIAKLVFLQFLSVKTYTTSVKIRTRESIGKKENREKGKMRNFSRQDDHGVAADVRAGIVNEIFMIKLHLP